MNWAVFEYSLGRLVTHGGSCRKVSVDDVYDSLEYKLNGIQKLLDYLTDRFRGGEYQLSTYIKEKRDELAFYEKIWDAVSKDEGRDEYYILEGDTEFPLVLEYRERKDYQLVYNEQTSKWEVVESMIQVPVYCKLVDYDNTGTLEPSNLATLLEDATYHTKYFAELHCTEYNGCRTLKCKECGKYFVLTPSEIEWFEKKQLVVPKRCPDCREARRKKAEEADKGTGDNLLSVV